MHITRVETLLLILNPLPICAIASFKHTSRNGIHGAADTRVRRKHNHQLLFIKATTLNFLVTLCMKFCLKVSKKSVFEPLHWSEWHLTHQNHVKRHLQHPSFPRSWKIKSFIYWSGKTRRQFYFFSSTSYSVFCNADTI